MTLSIDGFIITGSAEELARFIQVYRQTSAVDPYIPWVGISSFDDPYHIWEYHGKRFDTIDLNDLSDDELREIAIHNHLGKDVDLETLTRPELILLVGDIQSACSTNRNI